MGLLNSSENSLNQHIKLKHPELWLKLKDLESEVNNGGMSHEELLKKAILQNQIRVHEIVHFKE